mgnify:CR=1 FL=1
MIGRLSVMAYILISGLCLIYFWAGDAFLDPSFEYGDQKKFWLTVTQWLALLGPVVGAWLLFKLSAHISEDTNA